MSADSEALRLLGANNVEAATNIVSRQEVGMAVRARVKLAQLKFHEAAQAFVAAGEPQFAAAAMLLDPWRFHQQLRAIKPQVGPDVGRLIDVVLEGRLLAVRDAELIEANVPDQVPLDVSRLLAKYNITVVSQIADSAFLDTIAAAVRNVAPDVDAEELIASLVSQDQLQARIDQVAATVSFHKADEIERQSKHLHSLYDRLERLTTSLTVD